MRALFCVSFWGWMYAFCDEFSTDYVTVAGKKYCVRMKWAVVLNENAMWLAILRRFAAILSAMSKNRKECGCFILDTRRAREKRNKQVWQMKGGGQRERERAPLLTQCSLIYFEMAIIFISALSRTAKYSGMFINTVMEAKFLVGVLHWIQMHTLFSIRSRRNWMNIVGGWVAVTVVQLWL